MTKISDVIYVIVVTLWVGGLWAIGYVAAPVLFNQLADRSVAGMLAGKLFSIMAWISMGAAGYALLYLMLQHGWRCIKSGLFWIVVVMLLLTLGSHFGIAPILAKLKEQALPREVMLSVFKNRFMAWHGISSVMYLIQSVLGLMLVAGSLQRRE